MSTLQQRRTPASNNKDTAASSSTGKKSLSVRRKKNAVGANNKAGGVPLSIKLGMVGMLTLWLLVPMYLMKLGYWKIGEAQKAPGAQVDSHGGATSTMQQQPQQELKTPFDDTHGAQSQQRHAPLVDTTTAHAPPHITSTKTVHKLENEIVDMRDMAATLPFDDPDGGVWKQGWDVKARKADDANPIKIFVLPHSHCDPGWIKTFDDYFRSQTSGIITSVVDALAKDPKRKFIWAEISYFEWWWREQKPEKQEVARRLLKNHQLEFVTGGWVQPDEANTELYAMEVQLQEGHDWITKTFGKEFVPKYGWSIDPFGYSPTMAYLLKKYGFEGMLIQRVHYAVKKELASKKQLEFMWRQTWDDTGEYDIFTHLMPFYSYDVPHTCGPDPSVCCQFDFARGRAGKYGACPWHKDPVPTTPQNVHDRAMLMLDQHFKKAALYRGNAVLIPLGDDFRYRTSAEAEAQFTNFQPIFDYINKNVPGVQAQFGTLSDYFNEVIGSFDTPVLKGAFFTYSDREQDYWSGYFTSRVFDKALDRKLERVLYAAESMGATREEMQTSRRALSLFQHHDGVTGTAKTHVVNDYAKQMHTAINAVQVWLLAKVAPNAEKGVDACWRSDAPRGLSQNLCGEAEDVYVYNPLQFPQKCGTVMVPPLATEKVQYPCDLVGESKVAAKGHFKYDADGLMQEPLQEQWMKWQVTKGGAYLFFPGTLADYDVKGAKNDENGWIISTPNWKRTVVQHEYSSEFGTSATVLDFIYETELTTDNEEWFVRFTSSIQNAGVFHTDLNGFNFDTHHYRQDMPIQAQVFPMPTLASIEDQHMRMTILSEHAQGTASLETGTIDVWLDRRLGQDDNRGVSQGITDNVPTRTRLRVVIEREGFDSSKEFEITPLCRRMWEELQHPLEAFGKHTYVTAQAAKDDMGEYDMIGIGGRSVGDDEMHRNAAVSVNAHEEVLAQITPGHSNLMKFTDSTPIVPIVIMAFKRVDYIKECFDSIRNSDLDKKRVPIIISQDGDFAEMTEYIESLKDEFIIRRIVHPYSCFEHPYEFPMDSGGLLNKDYKGDGYKNPRDGKVTCCKHHFTWMLKTVYMDMKFDTPVDNFLFMEEDYIVAPNFYESIVLGLGFLPQATPPANEMPGFFGLTLDPTDGNAKPGRAYTEAGFYQNPFTSNPMVLGRQMIGQIFKFGNEYCEFDDYNWDWTIVHLMATGKIPRLCLATSKQMVKHVGIDGGMHKIDEKRLRRVNAAHLEADFHPTILHPLMGSLPAKRPRKGFGGWGHPADHDHCKMLLGVK